MNDAITEYFAAMEAAERAAERDAKVLFERIVKELGDDRARDIFSALLKRRRGKRQSETMRQIDEVIGRYLKDPPEWLGGSKMTTKNLAMFLFEWPRPGRAGLSVEAVMQRIKRLKRKMRAKKSYLTSRAN